MFGKGYFALVGLDITCSLFFQELKRINIDILDKKFSINGLLEFSTYCILFITVASLFSDKSQYFELLSHFKSQYFFSSLIFLVLLLSLKTYKAAMASFVALLLNFFFILPLYISPDFVENNSEGQSLKVIISNVYTANLEYQKIIDLVNEEAPDILVLQEVDSNWASRLEELKDILPYSIVRPRNDNFGIALFSRHKPLKQAVVQWGNINIPSIESQFEFGNNVFHILATHPLPPVSSLNYKYRNEQLFDVSVRARDITAPKIIMGDLNITTWSDDYKKLENDTGLKNARYGFGVLPTWPTQIQVLMIPIDHILVSEEFHVKSLYTGPDIGSDHLPLIAELIFK